MTQRDVRIMRITQELLKNENPASSVALAQRVVQVFHVRHKYAKPFSSDERCRLVVSCTDAWVKHRAGMVS